MFFVPVVRLLACLSASINSWNSCLPAGVVLAIPYAPTPWSKDDVVKIVELMTAALPIKVILHDNIKKEDFRSYQTEQGLLLLEKLRSSNFRSKLLRNIKNLYN